MEQVLIGLTSDSGFMVERLTYPRGTPKGAAEAAAQKFAASVEARIVPLAEWPAGWFQYEIGEWHDVRAVHHAPVKPPRHERGCDEAREHPRHCDCFRCFTDWVQYREYSPLAFARERRLIREYELARRW